MNPNQPDYSIDYLNQIAPQAPQKGRLSRLQIIAIAAVGLVILLIITIGLSLASGKNVKPTLQLAASLQSTETIVGGAQSKLKSTQLRTLNSNLKIYLTNTNRDIAVPLSNEGVNVAKLDKKLVNDEATTSMTTRLEDARLNAIYDRTYAREMAYRLETILALIQQVNTTTRNSVLKASLSDAYANLNPTQEQFAQFNAANS